MQTEAQSDLEMVTSETEALRERIMVLEQDNDRLKVAAMSRQAPASRSANTSSSPSQVR